MENSSICAILCHVDEHTLPGWRPCYGFVMTILSSHILTQKDSKMTLTGGLISSANRLSPDQCPDPYHSTMLGHSLMWVQALELELLSAFTGELGGSSQGGTPSMESRTLGGQKPLALNCLQDLSSTFSLDQKHSTSSSMGTILGWLKDGGTVEAEMKLSAQSSGRYTHYSKVMENQHSLHTIYVQSKSNPADGLSQGIYPLTALLLPPIWLPTELEKFIINSQEPLTPIEQRFHWEGRYPSPATKVINNVDKCNQASSRYLINATSDLLPWFSDHIWGDRLPNEVWQSINQQYGHHK